MMKRSKRIFVTVETEHKSPETVRDRIMAKLEDVKGVDHAEAHVGRAGKSVERRYKYERLFAIGRDERVRESIEVD